MATGVIAGALAEQIHPLRVRSAGIPKEAKMFCDKFRAPVTLCLLMVCSVTFLSPGGALAQDTWDGGGADDNWTTNNNWVDNTAPTPATTGALIFDGAVRLTPNADVAHLGVTSIDFAAGASAFTIGGSDLTFTGAATVTNLSANLQTINNNLVSGGASLLFDAQTANLAVAGTIDISAPSALQVTGAFDTTLSGVISGPAGTLTKNGAGVLTLSGVNTFGGGTTLNAGTIALGDDAALGTGTFTINAGAVQATAPRTITNAVAVNGNFTVSGSQTLDFAGTMDLGAATRTITTTNTALTTISGVISNGGLTKAGAQALELSGVNTFTGPLTINDGTLQLTGGAALADTVAVSLADVAGATLLLNTSETVGSLAGGGGTGGNVTLNANTLTAGGNNTSTTYAGVISGTGGLTKEGTGTLTLTGANTFTGTTNFNAGTLALTGGAALADASAVVGSGSGVLLLNNSETIGSLAGASSVNLQANTL
ncbi:MAG: autotransporter-associated beta strand repeat-containing protein, partial [Phycisphaeraceae bacterium]